ncbi:MAG: DUF262 domain-containing protein [Clostridia bacterium]|nr:DUF262 domain-containing protein [Clostridia bacterium]
MKIDLHEITVREVCNGYINNDEEGVVGFGGKLNIRPKYQREFVYKDKQRDEVINTVRKNFPLNVMYWIKNEDGTFEVLDGQQRTISLCDYVAGVFSINDMYFHNLQQSEKDQILDYKLMIYFCEGTDREKLDWFKIINIAGEKLTDQELRNAVYTGPWLSDAKRYFSKSGCPAYQIASDYMSGTPIRQDYLQTALSWVNDGKIEEYMSIHQHDQNANELWLYFKSVIDWVKIIFSKTRNEMKSVNWGELYNKHKEKQLDAKELEKQIATLMADDDVSKKSGIYAYVLDGDEKHLHIRAFTPSMKRSAYEKQKGICAYCKDFFEFSQMEGDHITPWHEGGATTKENCQMLCKECNRRKGGI